MSNTIEFVCFQNDTALEIQLEPEALIFVASPENSLKFVAINCLDDFKWSVRVNHEDKGVQLFPDTIGSYDIEIYENNELLKDF